MITIQRLGAGTIEGRVDFQASENAVGIWVNKIKEDGTVTPISSSLVDLNGHFSVTIPQAGEETSEVFDLILGQVVAPNRWQPVPGDNTCTRVHTAP
ncbi:MAG: hypothetical protein ACKOA8_01505 [Deltaproteobacteria bacterium]